MTSPSPFISPLSRPTSARLRSSLVIPTFPQVLSELVQNSLDAGAERIDCWLDVTPGNQSLRVEDDGRGISREGLRTIGERYVTSKERNDESLAPLGTYGFRGEALSSIGSLGLVEIITRTDGSRHTYTKVIKDSKVLFEGTSSRALSRPCGTTIIVKDLFHGIPVRQSHLAAVPPASILGGCKKVIETLALSRPGVKWSLWEDRLVGTSANTGLRRILTLSSAKNSLEVFRSLYGSAGVERVQNVRVTSAGRRMDGFISLEGSVGKTHQHLLDINNYPLDRGELHLAISKRFAASRFSVLTDDGLADYPSSTHKRKSPRRLERHPIYVLNITLPSTDVDASYEPKKGVLGYKDIDSIKGFVLAVVDEFLRRHGFSHPMTTDHAPEAAVSPLRPRAVPSPSLLRQPATSNATGESPMRSPNKTPLAASRGVLSTGDTSRRLLPFSAPTKRLQSEIGSDSPAGSARKRHKWIDDMLADINPGVFSLTPDRVDIAPDEPISISPHRASPMFAARPSSAPPAQHQRHHGRLREPPIQAQPLSVSDEVTFAKDALASARILGQVDNKFICCVLAVESVSGTESDQKTGPTLVLIDQHAADERVSVERVLRELAEGFINDRVDVTELPEPQPMVVLSREEFQQLDHPTVLRIVRRWGVHLEISTPAADDAAEYRQVKVLSVPSALKARLGRTEAKEATRLIKLYLPVLHDGLGEVEALIEAAESGVKADWGMALRWMPKEMLELANSKACRNAIMFGDRLDQEQCARLIDQLSKTRYPFMCAHGRPSLAPIAGISEAPVGAHRAIDWQAWKAKRV
ncbi:hypothetical protein JCM24511_03123 [Saitozyma sp. JCM 24511]|nr:hypothetical protein JCM24511_03123 [Saitozyma sp. JCM 24511]